MEKLYGLIGYPLTHSWSKNYFTEKFARENITRCSYNTYPLSDLKQLPQLIAYTPALMGLNVTIPYKEQVMDYLDDVSPEATKIGAVNTIKIIRGGKGVILEGHNTDVTGFEKSFNKYGLVIPSRALILGTGGASKAVEWVLKKYGCEVVFATRDKQQTNHKSYDELADMSLQDFPLIVNTTPLGMHPDTSTCPDLPYHTLLPGQILFDLVYNPEQTLFMQKGKLQGCTTVNGLYMLQQQAEAAWSVWNSQEMK